MKVLVRNVFSNWAGIAMNLVVAFLLSPFLVHSLGDSGYGLWVLVLSVTGYMGLLDTGLRVSIVKHTAKYNARGDVDGLNRVLFTALSLYGSLSCLIVVLSFTASGWFSKFFTIPPSEHAIGQTLVTIAGLNVALSLPLGVLAGLLSGLQRYDIVNRVNITVLLVRTAAIVAAVALGYGLLGLALIHTSSQLFTGALLFRAARQQFPQMNLRPRRIESETVRTLYSYSGYIILNNVAMFLLFYSGEVVIGMFIGTAAVTSFAIARSLVQYLSVGIGAMTQVFHPYASDLHERGDAHAVRQALIVGTKTSLLIALPIGISYVLIGSTFIGLWMGPRYGESAGFLLALLTIPQIVWLSQSTAGNILLGVGSHRVLTLTNLFTGIAGIGTGILLVPKMGSAGVAAGMAIPILVSQAIILPIYTSRIVGLSLRDYAAQAYLGPLLAAVPFATLLFVISRTWPASNLLALAMEIIAALVVFAPAAYFIALTRAERLRFAFRPVAKPSLANQA